MIQLLDGPYSGAVLQLRRCPIWLRVVCAREPALFDGEMVVDALDQLDDEWRDGEHIEIYRIVPGSGGRVHIRGHVRSAGGIYAVGQYTHQPASVEVLEHVRDTKSWRDWVLQQQDERQAA